MNKVLIPLDDSEFSLAVLPHVTKLLTPENNELFLLHVASKPEPIVVGDQVVVYADQEAESIREQNITTTEPLVHTLEKMGYHVSPELCFGDPATEIERFVADKDIDLIAMTTHGRQGLSRLLHGSIAQQLLHNLHVPLLLLCEESEDWFGGAIGE